MTVPVLTFFNNRGSVGQTTQVHHVAWMLADLGHRVLVCDLDPQVHLTARFLSEEQQAQLWGPSEEKTARTVARCIPRRWGDYVFPHMRGGEHVKEPVIWQVAPNLALIPGDPEIAMFEDDLAEAWASAPRMELLASLVHKEVWDRNTHSLVRAKPGEESVPYLRTLKAFSDIMQSGAEQADAAIILVDAGPNLGIINRAVLVGTDHVLVPLGSDFVSLRCMRTLGPALYRWRQGWQHRKQNCPSLSPPLPEGDMQPIGYTVQQDERHAAHAPASCDRWMHEMPRVYARNLLRINQDGAGAETPAADAANCLGTIEHHPQLAKMARDAYKPMFHLTREDGLADDDADAVEGIGRSYERLARAIAEKVIAANA